MFALSMLSLLLLSASALADVDYYWREYDGSIPPDAVPVTEGLDCKYSYIGQVYIHSYGLYVVQLYPGNKEVEVPCYGVKKVHRIIKILCTRYAESFYWLPTSSLQFELDVTKNPSVVGGYNSLASNSDGLLYVGRVMYQGMLKIGHVGPYKTDNSSLYFPHENLEQRATLYEILVYTNTPIYNVDLEVL